MLPAGSEFKRSSALGVRYLTLPKPECGPLLIFLLAFNSSKHNRTAVVVFDRHFSVPLLFYFNLLITGVFFFLIQNAIYFCLVKGLEDPNTLSWSQALGRGRYRPFIYPFILSI